MDFVDSLIHSFENGGESGSEDGDGDPSSGDDTAADFIENLMCLAESLNSDSESDRFHPTACTPMNLEVIQVMLILLIMHLTLHHTRITTRLQRKRWSSLSHSMITLPYRTWLVGKRSCILHLLIIFPMPQLINC